MTKTVSQKYKYLQCLRNITAVSQEYDMSVSRIWQKTVSQEYVTIDSVSEKLP